MRFDRLFKTRAKLGIRFWDYLGCRLDAPGAPHVAPPPQLIRQAGLIAAQRVTVDPIYLSWTRAL